MYPASAVATTSSPSSIRSPPFPIPPSVLAGDDVAGLQAVIAEQLLRHGYQVLEADHEEQAPHRGVEELVLTLIHRIRKPRSGIRPD